jgi:hypothetical protein
MASQGKVAVVTGGGSGIGRAAALALQGDGWNVVVAGRRKEELDKTGGLAKPGGGKIVAVRADVGKPEDVKACSPRPRRRSAAASTSCSTTPASARRRCRWRSCPSRRGGRWSTSSCTARSCAHRRRSRS